MLEPAAKRCLTHSLGVGLLGWALSSAILPTPGWASETLPPSVRACSTLTDRDTRLACFDREVASFPDPNAPSQAAKVQPSGAAPPGRRSAPATAATTTTPAAAAAPATSAKAAKADKPGRIAARVVSIDRSPDSMVLHLDNGQSWEQTQAVSGDLSLKVGDDVTIDKHLGSFWLNGPHVSGMKVRQKS